MTTCSTSATLTGNAETVVNRRDVTPWRSRPVSVISRVRFLAFMLLTTLLAHDQVSLRCPPSGHPAFAPGPYGSPSAATATSGWDRQTPGAVVTTRAVRVRAASAAWAVPSGVSPLAVR